MEGRIEAVRESGHKKGGKKEWELVDRIKRKRKFFTTFKDLIVFF